MPPTSRPIAARTLAATLALAGTALCLTAALPPAAFAHDEIRGQIRATDEVLASHPRDVGALLRRAELRRLAGDWPGAEIDLKAARLLEPTRADIDLCEAALAVDRGASASAIAPLDRFLANRPDRADARRLRARALLSLGRARAAVADLDRALASKRRATPDHYLERAAAQRAAGFGPRERLAGLDEGIARLGPVVGLVWPAIDLELKSGHYHAALARLDGLASGSARPEALMERRATILATAGRAREARATYAAALAEVESLPAAQAPAVTLVPRFSTWQYRDTSAALPAQWVLVGYDASTWPSGLAPLGYGDPFIATTIPYGPNPASKYITTYFRRSFSLGIDPGSVTGLTLAANYDDGFILYLNGTEVLRRSMPGGPVGYGTLAANHEGGSYETVDMTSAAAFLVPGQNLLAVEVHQQAPNSSDLAIDLELTAQTDTSITRGPYLQRGSSTGVTVRWRTNVATASRLRCGAALGAPDITLDDPIVTTEHEAPLTGLAPGTRYYYSVGTPAEVLAGGDSAHSFVTAPGPGAVGPTRLWILGDSGTANANAAAVRDAFLAYTGTRGADLWLMLGDNAYDAGTDAQYQAAVFDMYPGPLSRWVLWPTRGNHEVLYSGPDNDYYDLFTLPTAGECGGAPSGTEAYYSFDYANLHIVCLDSEGSDRSPGGAMAQWLAADLAATTRDWILAFWHHPPYTKGSHDSDNDLDSGARMHDMRAYLLPALEAGGVDLVLTGHSHSYERSFLLDGHYGYSSELTQAMKVDGGDGRVDGDGPYLKPSAGGTPHEGAVYAVAGSSGQTSGGALNHPVMITSLDELGSMVIDVTGGQLDARFLSHTGVVRDSFRIVKPGAVAAPRPADWPSALDLLPARPNPSRGPSRLSYTLPAAGHVRLSVLDALGRQQRVLVDGERGAGPHEEIWDGRDARGRKLPPGVFFVVLETRDGIWSRKLIRLE